MREFDLIETKPTTARLVVIGLTLLLGVLFFYLTFENSDKEYKRYDELRLAGRIDSVLSYSRGSPLVKLATGEKELIEIGSGGQKYLSVNDSLVKEPHSEIITLYRRFPSYTEVSVFGGDSTDENGLCKRYQIKKK